MYNINNCDVIILKTVWRNFNLYINKYICIKCKFEICIQTLSKQYSKVFYETIFVSLFYLETINCRN